MEVQTLPVIYLIPLSHFSFPFLSLSSILPVSPLSLNCISVSLQVKFFACPFSVSLHYFLHSISIRLSFLSLLPFSLPPPSSSRHLSLPSKQDITLPPNRRHSPPFSSREKVKINKTAIFFRFMCHGQRKYNHECVERVDEAIGKK